MNSNHDRLIVGLVVAAALMATSCRHQGGSDQSPLYTEAFSRSPEIVASRMIKSLDERNTHEFVGTLSKNMRELSNSSNAQTYFADAKYSTHSRVIDVKYYGTSSAQVLYESRIELSGKAARNGRARFVVGVIWEKRRGWVIDEMDVPPKRRAFTGISEWNREHLRLLVGK